jgi:hypothetical protein
MTDAGSCQRHILARLSVYFPFNEDQFRTIGQIEIDLESPLRELSSRDAAIWSAVIMESEPIVD